jgi:hypothetical protein
MAHYITQKFYKTAGNGCFLYINIRKSYSSIWMFSPPYAVIVLLIFSGKLDARFPNMPNQCNEKVLAAKLSIYV